MKILKGKPAPIINTIKHSYSQQLINLVIDNLLDKDPITRYGIMQTINSGIFNKYFREIELKRKMLQKKKKNITISNNNNNNNNNQNRNNTNRNKANMNNKKGDDKVIVKSYVITDSKRVRVNPLKGNVKASTLSRRAQIAKIPGKKTQPEASLHDKHIKMNNKYLNTYKEKIVKGEPKITASKYLHQVLLNDNDDDELYNESAPIQKVENNKINITKNDNNNDNNFNNINTLNYNYNINNDDTNNNNNNNNIIEDNVIKPQFIMMNEIPNNDDNIGDDDNNYDDNNDEYNDTNTQSILSELLKDSDYKGNENNKEDIPVIDNFEDVVNGKKKIKEIKDKEKTLDELQNEAYEKFGKEIVDDILNKYDEYQNDMNFDQTKELDELIFKKMNSDKKKYVDFLEIFYKIIYIKCAQQVEKTV